MGLRAGANKASAKKQPYSDFKKKTAKVGRKVKGGNVTKIEVTSKRIQIPLQSQITAAKPENEQENLRVLLKTLQHYSGPARTTALEDLKELLANSPSTESYISLIFPPALELLFDDERDTRKALVTLLTSLLTRFSSQSFLSIVPVTITYICSGLTSLNKGVRRDALSLLLSIANAHSYILIPHLEKLVAHTLALLVDPSQAGGQDSLGSTSSAIFATTGGSLSKAKLDDSWKKGNTRTAETAKPTANHRPPLLVAVLEVIDAILTSASQQPQPDHGAHSDSGDALPVLSLQSSNSSEPNQAIILRSVRRNCLHQNVGRSHAKTSNDTCKGDEESDRLLSTTLITDLCHRLENVWRGLILDSSVVAAHTVDVLILVAKVSYRLGVAFQCTQMLKFKSLVGGMFFKFPHSSLEASLAAPGSAREKSSSLKIITIDLYLCDVALLFHNVQDSDNDDGMACVGMESTHAKVNAYLMQKLHLYVEETSLELTRNVLSKSDIAVDVMEVDEEEESEGKKEEQKLEQDQELRTFNTSYSSISPRLFHALEVASLAAGRAQTDLDAESEKGSSSLSMKVLLDTLTELMGSFVQASQPSNSSAKFSRRSLLAAVEPTLKCLFSIAADSILWSKGYPEESFAPLASALSLVSSLIQAADPSDSIATSSSAAVSSSTSSVVSAFRAELSELGEAYARAMLSIVRRIPSNSEGEGEGEGEGAVASNKALDMLCTSIKDLFKAPRPSTPALSSSASSSSSSSSSSSKGPKVYSFYQYSTPATKYLLLDVFAHTPFRDVLAATKRVMAAVCSSSVTGDEQRYFLRIAFERRFEMGVSEFVDQLFSLLRMNITSRSSGIETSTSSYDSGVLKRTRDLTGRWLAHDIADVLVWCSSPEAPERILNFTAPFLTAFSGPVEASLGYNGGDSRLGDGGGGGGGGEKKWTKGWAGLYAASTATIGLCSRLLAPLLTEPASLTSPAAVGTVSTLIRACISVISLSGDVLERERKDESEIKQRKTHREVFTGLQLLRPVIHAFCMQRFSASTTSSSKDNHIDGAVSGHSDGGGGEGDGDRELTYFILQAFLAEMVKSWDYMSNPNRDAVLNFIKAMLKCGEEEVVAMCGVCNASMTRTLSQLAHSIDVEKGGMIIFQKMLESIV